MTADLSAVPTPSERLASAVRRRRAELGLSQVEVARAGGPSDTMISKIESGTWAHHPSAKTLHRLDVGLQWELGSAQDVLAGGEPATVTAATGSATQAKNMFNTLHDAADILQREEFARRVHVEQRAVANVAAALSVFSADDVFMLTTIPERLIGGALRRAERAGVIRRDGDYEGVWFRGGEA